MSTKTLFATAALAAAALWAAPAQAQAPNELNFQGKLTDASGNPITALTQIVYRIYNVATGGTALWSETRNVTPNASGVYSVRLGSVTPFPGSLTFGGTYFLELQVGTDAAMTPRYQMTSAPYSLRSARLGNLTDAGLASVTTVSDANLTTLTAGGSSNADSLHTHALTALTGTLADSQLSTNVVLLTGAQTVTGVKTFSTAPSFTATGISPFSVTSSTVVTNLNADLLDALSSADFLRASASSSVATGNTLTIASGATFNIAGGWQIGGTGVNASVTATALNVLTGGSTTDAQSYHTHSNLSLGSHTHVLTAGGTDVTVTAAILNQFTGSGATVTGANLTTLTNGSAVTTLHTHFGGSWVASNAGAPGLAVSNTGAGAGSHGLTGITSDAASYGVNAQNSNTTGVGNPAGLFGTASHGSGWGVVGLATGTTAARGVLGRATGATGTGIGVYGETASNAAGAAGGYFANTNAIPGVALEIGTGSLRIGGSNAGALVTGANLTTLTNASNADLLHTHAATAMTGTIADSQLSTNVALLNRTPQTFTGANTFTNTLSVAGATSLATGGGATSVGGSLSTTGNTTVGGNLTVTGTSTFSGSQTFGGLTATFNNLVSISGGNTFTVGTGFTTLGGGLSVAGAATFNNSVSVSGANTFTVGTGAATLGGNLSVAGTTNLNGTVNVSGLTTFSNALTANALSTFTGNFNWGSNAGTVTMNLGGTGAGPDSVVVTTSNQLLIDGNLRILGSVGGAYSSITSNATAGRVVTLPDATGTVLTTGNMGAITQVGVIGSGTWNGSIIAPNYGGTGLNTSATPTGSLLYTSAAGAWATLGISATPNDVLAVSGGGVPVWTSAASTHNHLGQAWSGAFSPGLSVTTTTSAGVGIEGVYSGGAAVTAGFGLHGIVLTGNVGPHSAVFGEYRPASGAGAGVRGQSSSPSGAGVVGTNPATGALGTSAAVGVSGINTGGGSVASNDAVFGVYGSQTGTGFTAGQDLAVGVFGDANDPIGVGVWGQSATGTSGGTGVYGNSRATGGVGIGVYGTTASASGYAVMGDASASGGVGVYGLGGTGDGVRGISNSNTGVAGVTTSGTGGLFSTSTGAYGLNAARTASAGATPNAAGYFVNSGSGTVGSGFPIGLQNTGVYAESHRIASGGTTIGIGAKVVGNSVSNFNDSVGTMVSLDTGCTSGNQWGIINWIEGDAGGLNTGLALGIYNYLGSANGLASGNAYGIYNVWSLAGARASTGTCYGYFGNHDYFPNNPNSSFIYGIYEGTNFSGNVTGDTYTGYFINWGGAAPTSGTEIGLYGAIGGTNTPGVAAGLYGFAGQASSYGVRGETNVSTSRGGYFANTSGTSSAIALEVGRGDVELNGAALARPAIYTILEHARFVNATTATAGSGSVTLYGEGVAELQSGTTSASTADIVNQQQFFSIDGLNRPGAFLSARFRVSSAGDANHSFWILAGGNFGGAPLRNGFGIRIVGTSLQGVVYNGGTLTSAALATITTGSDNRVFAVVRQGGSVVEVFLNGASVGTVTATVPGGSTNSTYEVRVDNGASITNARFVVQHVTVGVPMY